MFYDKTHLINWKLNSEIKSWWAVIFKMNRNLSMYFRHTHCFGNRYMLDIQILKKTPLFFDKTYPLIKFELMYDKQ